MANTTSPALTHTRASLTLAGARIALLAAHQAAQAQGWHIGVAVVDAAGELIALERDDAAIGISPTVATGKARTAALLREPSGLFEQFINGGSPSFLGTPGVTPLEGGMPIMLDGHCLGAVGISGAHGPNDTAVARAAVNAVLDNLSHLRSQP